MDEADDGEKEEVLGVRLALHMKLHFSSQKICLFLLARD